MFGYFSSAGTGKQSLAGASSLIGRRFANWIFATEFLRGSRAQRSTRRLLPGAPMSNAMIVNAAPVTRAIAPARVVAGRRLPAATPAAAPVASSRKLSIVSTAVMGRSGSSRTVVAAAFNFKNPFGGNSDEEEDAEEEAGGDSDTVEGNPFLSKSSVDEDSSSSSAPELPKLPKLPGNIFASFGAKEVDEEEEDEYEEEFEAPTKSGNPFGNPFASFGGMNQTIDQTVDLDYEDEDEEEPSKGGFGGFALPSFPKKDPPSAPPAQKKKEPEREKKTLGNWERTIREGKFILILVWAISMTLCFFHRLERFRRSDMDVGPGTRARGFVAAGEAPRRRLPRRRARQRSGGRLRRESQLRVGSALPVRDGRAEALRDGFG